MVVRAGSILFAASLLVVSGTVAASAQSGTDASQPRKPPRIRVYGGARQLPPNAVRQCRAWYVQEHRVSGTYVVPRMQCWWEPG
jgi:hypothetical protein